MDNPIFVEDEDNKPLVTHQDERIMTMIMIMMVTIHQILSRVAETTFTMPGSMDKQATSTLPL